MHLISICLIILNPTNMFLDIFVVKNICTTTIQFSPCWWYFHRNLRDKSFQIAKILLTAYSINPIIIIIIIIIIILLMSFSHLC